MKNVLFVCVCFFSLLSLSQEAGSYEALKLIQANKNRSFEYPKVSGHILKGQPHQGETGRLRFGQAMISQIVGTNSALVSYQWLGSEGVYKQKVLLKGVSVEGYADDMQIPLTDVYTINGTYTYQTVSGANRTVLVLTPSDNQATPSETPKPALKIPAPSVPIQDSDPLRIEKSNPAATIKPAPIAQVGQTVTFTLTTGRIMSGRVVSITPVDVTIKSISQDVIFTIRRDAMQPASAAALTPKSLTEPSPNTTRSTWGFDLMLCVSDCACILFPFDLPFVYTVWLYGLHNTSIVMRCATQK